MSKITIVAEMGISHQGKMNIAKTLISQAKRHGADLVKSQLYDVDKLFPDKKIITQGRDWYKEVKKTQLSKEQASELFEYGKQLGIEVFYSVFDLERLQWCEEIGVKMHKVGSKENKNKKLIEAMVDTKKKVLISCQNRSTIYNPIYNQDTINNILYLYCIPEYPTPLDKVKLNSIAFPHQYSGFSDHTIGIEASVCAMARGAKIIEKHFTLDKRMTGPDMICSMEPNELRELVRYARKFEEILHE